MNTFGSVGVAMVTPFHEDGSIDCETGQKLARHLVAQGADTILCFGTTGEAPTTHQPEKNEFVAAIVEAVGDQAFVMVGAGSNDTAHAVRMAKAAKDSGAHGLLVVSPYYSRPSQEGIYRHFAEIADATDLPVMLYDIPGRTGVKIGDETFDRIATHDNVVAVKDAAGSVPGGMAVARRTGLAYYSGDDDLNLAWLTAGAAGIVSVVGHVAAPIYRAMVEAVQAGDLARARELDAQAHPLVQAIMGTGQGAVMAKEALHLLGILPTPTLRLPLVRAPKEDVATLAALL